MYWVGVKQQRQRQQQRAGLGLVDTTDSVVMTWRGYYAAAAAQVEVVGQVTELNERK
jgi:hypothetical protein